MKSLPVPGALVRELSRLFVRSQRVQSLCVDGASNVQCHVLTELLRVDGLTQQALVERLSLDKAWISRAVESLVSDGVVSKAPHDTDKRSVQLSLTALGRIRAEKLEHTLNAHAAQVFEHIPLEKHAQIHDSLAILIDALQQGALNKVTSATSAENQSGLRLLNATEQDWPVIETMLSNAHLPLEGARAHLENFWLETVGEQVVAIGALELYGQYALLRSLAVDKAQRGKNYGEQMVKHLRQTAQAAGIKRLYLQTTSAADYFRKLGFSEVTRADVPAAIQQSSQFRGACPASAISMCAQIAQTLQAA
jgi:N-acetylglutamate synthase-like GNAT family acetyltransferase/DNA-binding MarR family transcriptional regulator